MIQWHRVVVDPRKFERAVQALLRSLYPGAEAMDGAGGDGGRDSTLRSSDGLTIFEIKSFNQRLNRQQQRNIEKSLQTAALHKPDRWVLILPLNHSPAEDKWWNSLKGEFPKISLEWWGIDWLDFQFAGREDLRRYVEGEEYRLLELAHQFRQERDVLARGLPDLRERVIGLAQRAADLSPHWTTDFATGPDGIEFRFRERYPGAAQRDPISFKPVFEFPPDDPDAEEIARRLRQVMDYGGDVTVPGQFVRGFNIDASDETRRAFGWDRPSGTSKLEIRSIEDNRGLPLPCVLDVQKPDGRVIASITLQLNRRVSGARGITLTGSDPSGLLTAKFILDSDSRTTAGSMSFKVSSPIGLFPYAARPAADFIAAIKPGNSLTLRMGVPFAECDVTEPIFEDEGMLVRLVVAFDELQKHFGRPFPIPEGLKPSDLEELEALVEFVKTGKARWPYHTLTMHVRADRLEQFVSDHRFRQERGNLLAHFESFSLEYGDNRFDFGAVQFLAPRVTLVNFEEVKAAVGTGVDPEGRWKCIDGEHIYMSRFNNMIEGEITGE
ncbi:hypothetical protein [Micromonospora sp. NPDC005806]|uniref:hypothetical protein n=1 Tax=Micromonospora sp. NPDC005806 TaxID=3364234 RepID=UPI0036A34F5F